MGANEVTEAVGRIEGATSQRVLTTVDGVEAAHNAWGERVAVERGDDAAALVRRAGLAAAEGERVAVVANAPELASARGELARIAARGLPVVVHAVAVPPSPGVPACESGIAPALTLGDLPWGMLLGAGGGEAIDLALVARRAAEDSRCPFIVVHERGVHRDGARTVPHREMLEGFLGGPRPPRLATGDEGERAFAERAPFALASAMRELGKLTSRTHDVLERVPGADGSIAIVGVGAGGASMAADAARHRAASHELVVVRLLAWRPFPGPRLVKALCRAFAVTVVEGVDRPLAANGPLTVQLKAAFADALTWAPDYPGIGRIPWIASAVVAPSRALDAAEMDDIVRNMLADERGKRAYLVSVR